MQRSVRGGFRNRARAGTTRHIRSQSAPQTERTSDLSQPLPAASRDPYESPRASSSLYSTDGLLHPTQPRPVSSAPPTEAQASSATPTQPQASSAPPSQPQASSAPPSQPQASNTTTTEGSPKANEPSTASAYRFTCGDAATSRKTAQNKRKAEVEVAPPATRSRRSAVEPGYEARGEARQKASELREGKRLRSGGTEAVCLTPSALPASQPVENTLNMAKSVRTPAEKKARGKGGEGCPVEERELKEMDVCGIRKVTHLVVVLPIKRTVKLCAAVSTVPYIVTEEWIKACEAAGALVAAEPYMIEGCFESNPPGGCPALSGHFTQPFSPLLLAVHSRALRPPLTSNRPPIPPDACFYMFRRLELQCDGGAAACPRRGCAAWSAFPRAASAQGAAVASRYQGEVALCAPILLWVKTFGSQVIIRNAGGEVVQKLHGSDGVIIVSCQEMRKAWLPHACKPGVSVISLQHLLTCVLRQNLTIEDGRLT
ncbi:MAG: hypothetical protein SGPRY_010221 [Prymnesium sp.]